MKELFFEQDTAGNNDMARCRILELKDGKKIKVEAKDPYGYWSVSYEKGFIPRQLSGSYTSYGDAKKAIVAYLSQKNNEVISEKLTVEDTKKE